MMFSRHAVRTLRSTLTKKAVLPSLSSVTTMPLFAAAQQQPRTFSTNADAQTIKNPDMFCRQCEQTRDNYACTTVGVCGKSSETAAIQDTLMQLVRNVGQWVVAAKDAGVTDGFHDADVWVLQAEFSTLTNVNFSDERIAEYIHQGVAIKKDMIAKTKAAGGSAPAEAIDLEIEGFTTVELEDLGSQVSVPARQAAMGNEDAFCLNELATYAMKGVCAYAAHCHQMGKMDADVMKDIHEVNAKLASNEPDVDGLLATVLRVGEINTRVLAMLDGAHAELFGEPTPTEVRMTPVEGKCILVSGHDMADLHELLKQTEGKGINIFTHGEMTPAHGYPTLKAFPHLVGNYGTAWQNQKLEFAGFPGPVIVTTNCIIEPRKMYKGRVYTMNEVGVDGVAHIGPDRDYSEVINQALALKGFPKTIEPGKFHTVGFNHRVVLTLADQVIEAAQTGTLSRIFLIGGCDGSQFERSYFTELAEKTPKDSLILTMGCAKNRIIHNKELLEEKLANGIPRVLDMGQCNDSYSAVVVAMELAKALDCTVNDLPLSLAVSHLEQKAAAVLTTLLHLGVKNIRLGPSLPAYLTPNVISILSKEYNLMLTGNAEEDLANMMQGK